MPYAAEAARHDLLFV